MALFDNVYLEDFDFMLEGEQAEQYKQRKEKEKARDHVKGIERAMNYALSRDEKKRDELDRDLTKAVRTSDQGRKMDSIRRHYNKEGKNPLNTRKGQEFATKSAYAIDAYDRHQRRHKKNVAEAMIASYEPDYVY